MNVFRIAACAALVFGAAPAFTQETEPGATQFTDRALMIAQSCFDAIAGSSPGKQEEDCHAASIRLDAARPASMNDHEGNVYNAMKAMTLTATGTARARQAGARTQASCDVMEGAWQVYASRIAPGRSPSRREELTRIRQQTLTAVRYCREDFGVPGGAAHLPDR